MCSGQEHVLTGFSQDVCCIVAGGTVVTGVTYDDAIFSTPLRDTPLRDTPPRAGRRDTPFRDIPFRDTPLRAGGRPRNVDQTLGLNHGDVKG